MPYATRSSKSARVEARRQLIRRLGALLIALAWLTTTQSAQAYCRTTLCGTDGRPGQRCEPPQPIDCGTPLFWRGTCLGFSAQREASRQVDLVTVESLMQQAFDTWSGADCGGGMLPSIHAENIGPVSCSALQYNQRGGNANVVMFRDEVWPYTGQGNTLALTTVTYNLDNGEIFDTDLEVNGTQQIQLTTGDGGVVYDLLSILTHEAGHMLGLAHSPDPEATMKIEYIPGDVSLRELSADDVAAICTAYPPERPGTCDPTPRHGFSSECVDDTEDDDDGGCAMTRPPADRTAGGALVVMIALGAMRLRRRRPT